VERLDKVRYFLDKTKRGLEIGPSFSPIVPKSEGWNVETIDHATREQLIEKYRSHNVDLTKIEQVDWVWDGQALDELLGIERRGSYDYFVASHVIEHYPDLLGFLNDVESLLRVDGVLSLVIPDKRHCFDFFKPLSLTGAVLAANHHGLKRHSKRTAFEHIAYSCFRDGVGAWNESQVGELAFAHTLEQALGAFSAQNDADSEYVDYHAWHFVPSSFLLIIEELRALGKTTFEVAKTFEGAGCEFYVTLRKSGQRSSENPGSPEVTARRLELMKQIMRELSQEPAFA
jgi:predicted SAM-dependent methyltransferase